MAFGDLGSNVETAQAVKWSDEDGDRIVGEVLQVTRVPNKFNSDKVDVNVKVRVVGGEHLTRSGKAIQSTEDGGQPLPAGELRTVYGSRGSLRNLLENLSPDRGDIVGVEQDGTYTLKEFPGREFPNYEGFISRAVTESGDTPFDS